MKIIESINIDATVSQVFNIYQDIENWKIWDVETESSYLKDGFILGSEGKLKPKGEPETKIKLVEVTKDRSFTIECKLPLCKMHFVHEMIPGDQTEVINTIKFTGLLGPIFFKMVSKTLAISMKSGLSGLKQFVEKSE